MTLTLTLGPLCSMFHNALYFFLDDYKPTNLKHIKNRIFHYTQATVSQTPQQPNRFESTDSARNLGIIFNEHIAFSEQMSSLSKSCYFRISALRYIRPYLDFVYRLLQTRLLQL